MSQPDPTNWKNPPSTPNGVCRRDFGSVAPAARRPFPQRGREAAGRLPRVRLSLVRVGPAAVGQSNEGTFEEWDAELEPADPLEFVDKALAGRSSRGAGRTGLRDAAVVGTGMIRPRRVAFGVTDSAFIMGSMGSVVGEKLTRTVERATAAASAADHRFRFRRRGRMHEGMFSLMQMAKVSAALARLDQGRRTVHSVLTNPTMGGVAASFASLGDVVFAEPGR